VATAKIRKALPPVFAKLARWECWKRIPFKLLLRYVAPERPRRFPVRLQIEATSRCNLRCLSCSHSRETGTGRHLSEEDLGRILDRLPWSPARVVLSGVGEPLVNPRFFALVDILAARGIKCEFYTNGTLLTAAAQEEILSRPNIDAISISCDGATKATFEGLRLGADFERWRQSVRELSNGVKWQPGRKLSLTANVVVSKQNLSEVPDIVRLAARLGFQGVSVMDSIPVDDVAAALCPTAQELGTLRREDLAKLAGTLGLKLLGYSQRAAVPPQAMPRCTQPWEYIFVGADGDVAPCCALFGTGKRAVMGNILRDEFQDIWRGERFRQFRKSSALGTNALCRICPMY
jgi:radical SAM protein with 4Fe4S-binding SPASM domain